MVVHIYRPYSTALLTLPHGSSTGTHKGGVDVGRRLGVRGVTTIVPELVVLVRPSDDGADMDDDGASPRADVCGSVERLVVDVCWDADERSRGRMEER